jgi:hypothetical protein
MSGAARPDRDYLGTRVCIFNLLFPATRELEDFSIFQGGGYFTVKG